MGAPSRVRLLSSLNLRTSSLTVYMFIGQQWLYPPTGGCKCRLGETVLTKHSSLLMPLPPFRFDIFDFDARAPEDEAGMLKAVTSINKLIQAEVDAGIPSNRILIGGFSQGGAMSLLTALTAERKFAGVAVLSGWLPLSKKMKAMATPNNTHTPMFWGHGEDDPLIEYQTMGLSSIQFLKNELGIKSADPQAPEKGGLTFFSYEDIPHSTSTEELRDLQEWLKRVMQPAAA